ncbi:hypothetical protein FQN53_005535 [Emmonsiellopsis sp. PD_33]|nr:hypothetical protein FQN53_005535 [Emmonsiellopsis sp. PD_33]
MATTVSRRGAVVICEETYASQVLTLALQGYASPPLSRDGRSRRTRGSSSDEDPVHGDMINQDFRAGGPNLCVLPCHTLVMEESHPASVIWSTDPTFPKTISEILRKHRVEATSIGLFMRKSEVPHFSSEAPRSTVLIGANKTKQDDGWVQACIEIRGYLLRRQLPDVNVEIIDKRAVEEIFTFSVLPSDPIVPLWSEVCSRIMDFIGRQGWVALECFRRGTSYEASENPVTVILTVPYESEKDWKPVREQIVHILTQMKLPDVAVSIIHGEIFRASGDNLAVLPSNAWETEAQCGMSIGPLGSHETGSTLGAFIELLNPKNEWKRLALTCFHCIFEDRTNDPTLSPSDRTIFRGWRANGIRPGDPNARTYLEMSQPSLRDHESHVKREDQRIDALNRQIEKVKNQIKDGDFVIPSELENHKLRVAKLEDVKKEKDRVEKFISLGQHNLGHVFTAPGFRTTQGKLPSQLDWALIRVKKARNGINKIPPSGSVGPFENRRLRYPSVPNADEPLYKIGRTTGFKEGKYSILKSVLLPSGHLDAQQNPIEKETYEHVITGVTTKFSQPGDSGAVIFDQFCNFIGLLFAGSFETNATYFTPAETLFEDIKKMTGALDVRIPEDIKKPLDVTTTSTAE